MIECMNKRICSETINDNSCNQLNDIQRKCNDTLEELKVYFYHDLLVMSLNLFNAFTVTVTLQSVLWKYAPKLIMIDCLNKRIRFFNLAEFLIRLREC